MGLNGDVGTFAHMALLAPMWPAVGVPPRSCRSHPEREAAAAARGGDRCMRITSTTDLAFPGRQCAIRQGAVKDVPAAPAAAARM